MASGQHMLKLTVVPFVGSAFPGISLIHRTMFHP